MARKSSVAKKEHCNKSMRKAPSPLSPRRREAGLRRAARALICSRWKVNKEIKVPGGEARRGNFQLKSNGFWLAATEGRRSGQDEKNLEKSDPGRGKKESGAK